MKKTTAWLLTTVVGVAIGVATFVWLISDALLAVALGFIYGVCTRLWTQYGSTLPGGIRGDDWNTTRWSGAFVLVVMGTAIFGVTATLPLSSELRLALQLLVLGTGFAGLLLGVAMTRAQLTPNQSVNQTNNESGTDTSFSR